MNGLLIFTTAFAVSAAFVQAVQIGRLQARLNDLAPPTPPRRIDVAYAPSNMPKPPFRLTVAAHTDEEEEVIVTKMGADYVEVRPVRWLDRWVIR